MFGSIFEHFSGDSVDSVDSCKYGAGDATTSKVIFARLNLCLSFLNNLEWKEKTTLSDTINKVCPN